MAIYFSNHFGQETAGLLLILSQVIGTAIGLLGGYCADHFGRKRMMVFQRLVRRFALHSLPLPTHRG
ncbi:hypothetical protein NBRC111894_3625 [Sporolactobacillus inulinus]|uniref:Major facilitator superfamily (MFS) profile domain-containing protein n=1 Tax=Sporolactobacillus inulinus TaxID=2078 RepID=A0A4Y1ZGJ7_9BACL|nr:hypothetical protein [Sporolactobacillus inulinus]GAY78071.1 hypothetical protein NBRC111894_3625 [Sporolactobacillus inulinus]